MVVVVVVVPVVSFWEGLPPEAFSWQDPCTGRSRVGKNIVMDLDENDSAIHVYFHTGLIPDSIQYPTILSVDDKNRKTRIRPVFLWFI